MLPDRGRVGPADRVRVTGEVRVGPVREALSVPGRRLAVVDGLTTECQAEKQIFSYSPSRERNWSLWRVQYRDQTRPLRAAPLYYGW